MTPFISLAPMFASFQTNSWAKVGKNKINILKISLSMLLLFLAAPSYALTGLKTQPANASHLLALRSAVEQVSIATTSAARSAALNKLAQQVLVVKEDINGFYNALAANGETAALDKLAFANAGQLGGGLLQQELQRYGGASNVLKNANAIIDDEIKDFIASLSPQFGLLDLFGISKAYASIRSTACGFFWFVIGFGYGTEHAYVSCYRD